MQNDDFPFDSYDWKNRQLIGSGGFGKVFKVKAIKSPIVVAIKQIDMSKFDADFKRQALKNQITAMTELSNKNTVNMLEHRFGHKFTYVVLELCDGDLKKQLQVNGQKLPEDHCIDIMTQILQGFRVLIDKGYIHRDVKPQNILIKDNIYKLADYGFSKKVNLEFQKLREVCGTPFYMAPQLLYNKDYTSKCDIWSLGLLFYQMLFGYFPWTNRHIDTYKQAIVNRPVSFPYRCEIGQNTKDFIEKCLQLEQQDRFNWKTIFQHELIRTGKKGPPIKYIPIDNNTLKILIRMQESSSRKFINVQQLFIKYEKYKKMNYEQFYYFIREVDPQITTYESKLIFQLADTSKDGLIDFQQFKQCFIEIDYRPVDDIASRRIQQIVKMAKARKLNIREFFDLIDKDKSSKIEYQQFVDFVRYIAPKIPETQVKLMWNKFDKNKTGSIGMQQFVSQVTRGVPGEQSHNMNDYERAKRNVICLKNYLKQKKVTSQQFFGKARLQKHQQMRLDDFGPLIQQINYIISKQQIKDMFKYIDRNRSGTIQIQQIALLLDY